MKKKNRRWFIYLTSNFYPLASSFYLLTAIFYLLSSVTQAQSLADYQKQASENNPGLQAKYKEFEAAMQKIPQMNSLPDPSFSIGYFISPVETRVGPQRAKLSLTQMFPWFGTLKVQGDAAALLAESKYQAFIDMRNNLFYRVAAAYYPLYELKEWQRIDSVNLELLNSFKSIASKKYENGQGSLVNILRVDIMMKEVQTNLSILQEKKKPLVAAFNNILNVDVSNEVKVMDTITFDSLPIGYRKDSISADHPLLKELSLKEAAMVKQEQAAIKQGLPKLGVGLDYVFVGDRTDLGGMAPPSDNGKNVFMPMVTMSIPIFRAKYKAAKKEAQLMQESYMLMKKETQNSLNTSYDDTWYTIDKNQQFMQLYQAQITETDQALNLLLKAYANDGNDFEEVLRMQQQLLKYKTLNATASMNYKIAEARLNYITAKNY